MLSSLIRFSSAQRTTSPTPSSLDSTDEPFLVSHATIGHQVSPSSLENHFCQIFPSSRDCVCTSSPTNLDFLEIVYSCGSIMSFDVSNSKSGHFSFLSLPTITNDKLIRSANYTSWAAFVELWCMGHNLKDHLTTKAKDLTTDKASWIKTDAWLCSLLW